MSSVLKSFLYLPLGFVLLLGIGFFVCYAMAVTTDHVVAPPGWPFVSDTGATPPESCIFTFVLTWGAFITLVTMVLYHKYVVHQDKQSKKNIASLIIGFISVIGMTLVGSFQFTNVEIVHLIGAFLAFVGATIYSWIVVAINLKQLISKVHGRGIVYVRIILALTETISLILVIVGFALLQNNTSFYNFTSINEWILIYSAVIFVGTLTYDLRHIRGVDLNFSLANQLVDKDNNVVPMQNYSNYGT